jgi:CHAT domain-containing protein
MRWIAILVLAAGCTAHSRAAPDDPRQLLEDGRQPQAETLARANLEQAEKAHGADSPEVAEALGMLAETARQGSQGTRPETCSLCERAVELGRKHFAHADARLATALLALGMFHVQRDEYAAARPLLEEALAIRKQALGPDSSDVARTLIALANLTYAESHDLERSLAVLAEAQAIHDRTLPLGHRDVGFRLSRQAVLLHSAGDIPEARALNERALAIQRKALRPGHPLLALTLYNLSLDLKLLGDYAGARDRCREALDARIAAYGATDRRVAWNLRTLADLHLAMGQRGEAQKELEQALNIFDAGLGPDSTTTLECALDLANAALCNGQRERAEELLQRCRKSCEEHPQSGDRLLPFVLRELGFLHESLEELAAAQAQAERVYGEDDPSLVTILETRAGLLSKSGDDKSARELLERAVRIEERAAGPASPDLPRLLETLVGARQRLGEAGPAFAEALRAEALARTQLVETARGFEQELLLDYASTRSGGLDLALELAASGARAGEAGQAFDALIRSRALVLDLAIDRVRFVHASTDPGIAALAAELEHASSRLSNLLVLAAVETNKPPQPEQLEAARAARAELEQRLAKESASFCRDRERSAVGLAQVAAALPGKSALVSYFRGRSQASDWFAFVLAAGRLEPALVRLGPASEIDPLIARTADAARRRAGEAEFRAAGEQLRERIWDPLVERLGGAERVFLVPDASLSFVDFASLPIAGERYLIESAPLLHELTTERDLVAQPSLASAGDGLLALGGPDFDEAAAGAQARLHFSTLPEMAVEAKAIAALWPEGSTVLTGAAASESEFKRLAPRRAVLHLATHAFFLEDEGRGPLTDGTRGRPVGVSPRPTAPALPEYRLEHPLLLAGLALAGANRHGGGGESGDDGVLTSDEIAALDLTGTQWAVLSACGTGLGVAHSAEGVLGLRRAFLIAGARTVISSLWELDDTLAREWMVALYGARFEQKLGTAEALRAVGLEMLQRRRAAKQSTEPASWAGFVAVGDWR